MGPLNTSLSRSAAFFLIVSASQAALTGCSLGKFPDTQTSTTVETGAVVSPALQGSVYGGHAPLVGAQVYVLSPNLTSLHGQSISLMDGDSQNLGVAPSGTGNGAVSANGTNGYHYVTTDATGSYNLTGDYACTVDQAVYLVAVGGSPTFPSASNAFQISQIVVSNLTGTGDTETATFTITVTTTENFYIGEMVTFTNLTGVFAGGDGYSTTVIATNLTTTTFAVSYTDPNGTVGAGTYATTGTVTASPTANPAAINMTALGLCPSSGSFAGHISYIYTNEVSTAAMAIATAAFGSGPFNVGVATGGPVDTNYASYDKNGLKQALNNAGLLYDITGGNVSTTYAGEGHIARAVTPAGNGIIPQALMDTWGNILAACVDSANTGTGTLASAQCVSLFSTATSTGIVCTVGGSNAITCPSGTTAPTDIATAAFNIAHYPAGTATTVGTNPAFVNTLYTLPTGNPPFAPNLVSTGSGQPNDFSVAIGFYVPQSAGSTTNIIGGPQVIAINGGNYVGNESNYTGDANGELQESVWVGSYNTQAVKLYANGGVPDFATNAALASAGSTDTRSVVIDAAENVLMTQQNGGNVEEFSVTGKLIQTFVPTAGNGSDITGPADGAIDGTGTSYNFYYAAFNASKMNKLAVVNGTTPSITNLQGGGTAGTAAFSVATAASGSGTAACQFSSTTAAFTPAGTLFVSGNSNSGATNGSYTCTINTTSGVQGNTPGTGSGLFRQNPGEGPAIVAVDGNGVAWIGGGETNASPGVSQGVYSITASGTKTAYTGGGMNDPCGVAVDGNNNIWVGNAGTYGLTLVSNAGVMMSPVANTGTYTNAVGGLNPQIKNTYALNGTTYFNSGTTPSNCASPAIDRAGDVWVAYQGSGSYYPGVIFEVLGVAAPVVSPRAYATFGNGTTGFLGQRPY